MRKAVCLVLIMCMLLTFTAYAEPGPVISRFDFLPDGQAYHHFSFYDEWLTINTYDGKSFDEFRDMERWWTGDASNGNYINDDGFVRYVTTINGNSYYTNLRYKVDEKNLDDYPKGTKKVPFYVTMKNQSGKSVVDGGAETVTIYAEEGKRLKAEGMSVRFTDYGRQKYNLSVNDIYGTFGRDTFISNKVTDFDRTAEKGNQELIESDIKLMAKETIDLTKDTYLYIWGEESDVFKYKVVVASGENPVKDTPRVFPAKAVFDKRACNSANVIITLLDFKTIPNVLINGQKVAAKNNYSVIEDYLVLSKDYLNKFNAGEKLSVSLESGGKSVNVEINITDTTDKSRKPLFGDVVKYDEYRVFIESLTERKIIAAGQNFYPERAVTKAEFCAMLSNALGIGSTGGNKYNGSIKSIDDYKILSGIGAQQAITYKQASQALIQVLQANSARNKKIIDSLASWEDDYDEYDKSYLLAVHVPVVEPELVATNKMMPKKECAKAVYRFISLSDLLKDDNYILHIK